LYILCLPIKPKNIPVMKYDKHLICR